MSRMSSSLFLLLSVLLVTLTVHVGSVYQQRFVLEGYATLSGNYPDLSEYDLERVEIFCPSGFWIGYSEVNFQGYEDAWGFNDGSCSLFTNKYKSLRHGGASIQPQTSISFYANNSWQGVEKFYDRTEVPFISEFDPQSVVVSGAAEYGWSLFEDMNYAGVSICLTPKDGLFLNSIQNIKEKYGWSKIGSASYGNCWSSEP